ncbi:hypothetical protein [Brevundimonas sp.]|uniref:hypothetical protein n=1 Tax=Brevundimonas sp. TaxID=1871086 RepID=UPI002FCC84F2
MIRLSILFAVMSFICAGAEVFRRVTTGRTDDPFAVFLLMGLAFAFVLLALLFQRVGRLEAALNQQNLTSKDH